MPNNDGNMSDVDFRVNVATHIAKISTNVENLVKNNEQQDKNLESTRQEINKSISEIRDDVKKNRSFLDKTLGVMILLVFLVPAIEAWILYESMRSNTNSASATAVETRVNSVETSIND